MLDTSYILPSIGESPAPLRVTTFLDLFWTKILLLKIVLWPLAHLMDGPSASVALGLDLCTFSLCRVTYLMLVRAGLMHNVSCVLALLPLCRLTYLVSQLSKRPSTYISPPFL